MKNYSLKSGGGESVPSRMDDVPPHVYTLITEFLLGVYRQGVDLREPYVRDSLRGILPFVLIVYGLIIVFGFAANVAVIVHAVYYKLAKDPTYTFVINNAISDIVKCAIVLPISLYVLLVHNWLLGELLCSFLPMLQDIPFHVTTLTFVLTAWDRYRYVSDASRQRLPAFVCAVGTWFTAVCLVLPFPIYIIYVDLGRYSHTFDGIGFCVVNLTDDMQEYMRGIFLIMYAAPLATISYLYIKSSQVLNMTSVVVTYEARHRTSRTSHADSQRTSIDVRSSRGESELVGQLSRGSIRSESARMRFQHERNEGTEPELDPAREKRINKYLSAMVTVFAICFCPLMILRVARLALLETYDNTGHFDIIYTTLVWLAFLPTCSTPILYASWHLSRETKERLQGYLRMSFRIPPAQPSQSNYAEEFVRVAESQPHPVLSRNESNRSIKRQQLEHQEIPMCHLTGKSVGMQRPVSSVHRQLPVLPYQHRTQPQLQMHQGLNFSNEIVSPEKRLLQNESHHCIEYGYPD